MFFSRASTRLTAWAALMAVLFVVLMPTAISASGISRASPDPVGLSAICTLDGAKMLLPDAPDVPGQPVAHQQHCAFCSASVPLFADANRPSVVAVIDGSPTVFPRYPAELLPPDLVALQPLSPRAPPRR